MILLLLCLAAARAAVVRDLTPDTWNNAVPGRRWVVYFALQGCKHCERLRPMIEHVADMAPEIHFGRVDATAHNGLARTFGVQKFPMILLFQEDGTFFEYNGVRSPPRLLAFGRGDPTMLGAGKHAPTELLGNVSNWWLMAEALWDPLKLTLKWSVGIAVSIKALSQGCLWCLERRGREKQKAAARGKGD